MIKIDQKQPPPATIEKTQIWLTNIFRDSGLGTAEVSARVLLSHVCKLDEVSLIRQGHDSLTSASWELLCQFSSAHLAGKPLSRILQEREFYGLNFHLNDATLDPRPESELLVEQSLHYANKRSNPLILDLGTGTGCLLLSCLYHIPQAQGVGVDVSIDALTVACRNAQRYNLNERVTFQQSHWFETVTGAFDIIMSNPPYICTDEIINLDSIVKNYDPIMALDGGRGGLVAYHNIISNAAIFLKKDGVIIVEIGHQQRKEVTNIFKTYGYKNISVVYDFSYHARVLIAQKIS